VASNDRTIKLTIVGNADSGQKALQQTAAAATQAEVKVEGFGKAFAKMGVAFGAGALAVTAAAGAMSGAVDAVADYTQSVDLAERQLRGMLGSQDAANQALAVARAEADKGRGTYQELAAAMAGLSSVAKTAGMSLQSVTEIAEILAAVNPAEGLAGATFALREAASGDMTSIIERFNLSRTTINKLRAEGVPAIEAVRRAMVEMGYDTKFLTEVNGSAAKQSELLKGRLTELAAIGGEPIFEVLNKSAAKLLSLLEQPGSKNFVTDLAATIETFLAGNLLNSLGTTVAQVWYLAADAFNDFLKAVSFDKLNIDEPLRKMFENISNFDAAVKADTGSKFAEVVANNLSGDNPGSPLAPAKVEGYGRDVLTNYLAGLTSADISGFQSFAKQFEDIFKGADGKTNTDAFAQAQSLLATALQEVAGQGQITAQTFYAMAAVFGDNTANVIALVNAYGALQAAQGGAAAGSTDMSQSQAGLQSALAASERALEGYQGAIDGATAAAERHAEAAAAAIEPLADRLDDVGEAAAASARESAAAIQALQDAASRNAAAYAEAEAAAQEELTAIQERRRQEAEALYNSIVDGERRALEAAQNRVDQLGAKGRKEDLTILRQIQAAEDAGNTKEAARLRRVLEGQRKRRRGEEELAAAEAAVARDEFDAADKRADKEVERLDERTAKEEEAAKAKIAAIQQAAKDQAAADAAAIKGAQDAAKAEAERYRKQQEGIQKEIDGIRDAAEAQAKKDAQAIKDARAVYAEQATINANLETALGRIEGRAATTLQHERDTAAAAKEHYEWIEKLYQIYANNPPGSPGGPPTPDQVAPPGFIPHGAPPNMPPAAPSQPPAYPGGGGGGGTEYLRGVGNFRSSRRDWDAIVRGGPGGVANG
jgi:hypothetical protein